MTARQKTTNRDDDTHSQYLTGPMVSARYNISDMGLHRWLNDESLNFPQPSMVVRGRRYWLEATLIEWERSRLPGSASRREREVA